MSTQIRAKKSIFENEKTRNRGGEGFTLKNKPHHLPFSVFFHFRKCLFFIESALTSTFVRESLCASDVRHLFLGFCDFPCVASLQGVFGGPPRSYRAHFARGVSIFGFSAYFARGVSIFGFLSRKWRQRSLFRVFSGFCPRVRPLLSCRFGSNTISILE